MGRGTGDCRPRYDLARGFPGFRARIVTLPPPLGESDSGSLSIMLRCDSCCCLLLIVGIFLVWEAAIAFLGSRLAVDKYLSFSLSSSSFWQQQHFLETTHSSSTFIMTVSIPGLRRCGWIPADSSQSSKHNQKRLENLATRSAKQREKKGKARANEVLSRIVCCCCFLLFHTLLMFSIAGDSDSFSSFWPSFFSPEPFPRG